MPWSNWRMNVIKINGRVTIPGCDNLHHSSEREHSSRKAQGKPSCGQ